MNLNDLKINLAHKLSRKLHELGDLSYKKSMEFDANSEPEFNAIIIPSIVPETVKNDIYEDELRFSTGKENKVTLKTPSKEARRLLDSMNIIPYVVGNIQAPETFFELGDVYKHNPFKNANRQISVNGTYLRELNIGQDDFNIDSRSKIFSYNKIKVLDSMGEEISKPAAIYTRDGGSFIIINPENEIGTDRYVGRNIRDTIVGLYSKGSELFEHNTLTSLKNNEDIFESLEKKVDKKVVELNLVNMIKTYD